MKKGKFILPGLDEKEIQDLIEKDEEFKSAVEMLDRDFTATAGANDYKEYESAMSNVNKTKEDLKPYYLPGRKDWRNTQTYRDHTSSLEKNKTLASDSRTKYINAARQELLDTIKPKPMKPKFEPIAEDKSFYDDIKPVEPKKK